MEVCLGVAEKILIFKQTSKTKWNNKKPLHFIPSYINFFVSFSFQRVVYLGGLHFFTLISPWPFQFNSSFHWFARSVTGNNILIDWGSPSFQNPYSSFYLTSVVTLLTTPFSEFSLPLIGTQLMLIGFNYIFSHVSRLASYLSADPSLFLAMHCMFISSPNWSIFSRLYMLVTDRLHLVYI